MPHSRNGKRTNLHRRDVYNSTSATESGPSEGRFLYLSASHSTLFGKYLLKPLETVGGTYYHSILLALIALEC